VRARRGLKGEVIHPADFAQVSGQPVEKLEVSLGEGLRRIRVQRRETIQAGRVLVHLGVVFHRAGPQGVEARVDAEIPPRQPRIVTNDIDLGHFRQIEFVPQEVAADESFQRFFGDVAGREGSRRASGPAFFENEFHGHLDFACNVTSNGGPLISL